MQSDTRVEEQLEKKLERWQAAQNKAGISTLVFSVFILVSFLLDHLFLTFFILGLMSSLLLALLSYQRIDTLSRIKGHTWTDKNT